MRVSEWEQVNKPTVDRSQLSIGDPAGMEAYLRAPASYFGSMDPNSLDDLFFCRAELEAAESRGDLDDTLEWLGVPDKEHWWRIEAAYFRRHFGTLPPARARAAYVQYLNNARIHGAIQPGRPTPAMVAPAGQVPVETWAQTAAGLSRCTSDAQAAEWLAQQGLSSREYRRVNEEFRDRMRADRTGAIAAIYTQAFMDATGSPRPEQREPEETEQATIPRCWGVCES